MISKLDLKRRLVGVGVAFFLSLTASLSASNITYSTPSGSSTSAGPVSADATFTVSAGQLQITLQDLLANPKDAGQLLSDLQFTLNLGLTGTPGFTSSAQQVTVNTNGSFTLASTAASTGWGFGSTGAKSYILCVICSSASFYDPVTANPSETIIGPPGGATYSNANGSIDGNGPHNPFLNQTATFTITDSAINSDTRITSATFSFSTTPGVDVPGVPTTPVPEPATFQLIGAGLGAVGVMRNMYRKLRG